MLMRMAPTYPNTETNRRAAMMIRENKKEAAPNSTNVPPRPKPLAALAPVTTVHASSTAHGTSMHTANMTSAKNPRLYSRPSSLPSTRAGSGACTFQAMSRAHPNT